MIAELRKLPHLSGNEEYVPFGEDLGELEDILVVSQMGSLPPDDPFTARLTKRQRAAFDNLLWDMEYADLQRAHRRGLAALRHQERQNLRQRERRAERRNIDYAHRAVLGFRQYIEPSLPTLPLLPAMTLTALEEARSRLVRGLPDADDSPDSGPIILTHESLTGRLPLGRDEWLSLVAPTLEERPTAALEYAIPWEEANRAYQSLAQRLDITVKAFEQLVDSLDGIILVRGDRAIDCREELIDLDAAGDQLRLNRELLLRTLLLGTDLADAYRARGLLLAKRFLQEGSLRRAAESLLLPLDEMRPRFACYKEESFYKQLALVAAEAEPPERRFVDLARALFPPGPIAVNGFLLRDSDLVPHLFSYYADPLARFDGTALRVETVFYRSGLPRESFRRLRERLHASGPSL